MAHLAHQYDSEPHDSYLDALHQLCSHLALSLLLDACVLTIGISHQNYLPATVFSRVGHQNTYRQQDLSYNCLFKGTSSTVCAHRCVLCVKEGEK